MGEGPGGEGGGDYGMGDWLGEPVDVWRGRWGVPLLQVHRRVTSTNDLARRLADQGAPHGATIIADEQTRGRGRRGREWTASPGTSLLLSMVIRPRSADTLLSLRLGIAAARAIEAVAPVRVGVKWPNDLLVDGFKVGGILCEGAREAGRPVHMVAGVGINLRQADHDWPPPLRGLASSLDARVGGTVERARLTGAVVDRWLAAAACDSAELTDTELAEFRQRDTLFGLPVSVDGEPAGVGQGIDSDGALRVGAPHAPRRLINGTVRILETAPGEPS